MINTVNADNKNGAIAIFIGQLTLNFMWSFLFFNQHQIFVALVDIGLLWVMILLTIIFFNRTSKPAAALLIPYLLWVSFATALNYSIWKLN